MPQFTIEAADQKSGQSRIVILEAPDAREAEKQAQAMGLLVSGVQPFSGTVPQSGPASRFKIRVPKWVLWLALTCVVTGGIGLYGSSAWEPAATHDAYETYVHICGWIGLPIDGLLVVTSIALLMCKPWARQWLIRWAVISFVFQTLTLAITIEFMASRAKSGDLSPLDSAMQELQDAMSGKPDPDAAAGDIDYDAEFGWVSMFSLQSWVFIALRRKKAIEFFEPHHADPKPSIPKVTTLGRKV